MTIMPKKLIIDKDTFVGINLDDLCNFVKNHLLILPLCLHDECVTNEEKRRKLLVRFRRLILSGGWVCPSGRDIIEKEGQTLQPYDSLVDFRETKRMRRKFKEGYILSIPDSVNVIQEKHIDAAQISLDSATQISKIFPKKQDAFREIIKLQANRLERFKIWIKTIESEDIHKLVTVILGNLTTIPEKFCLSNDWVTWHYFCLAAVLVLENDFLKRGKGGNSELTRAEHNIQDIEYVYLLSRADALLTRDKKLVIPLAKAAFPDKDVFSSLDEVPEEYVCNWT